VDVDFRESGQDELPCLTEMNLAHDKESLHAPDRRFRDSTERARHKLSGSECLILAVSRTVLTKFAGMEQSFLPIVDVKGSSDSLFYWLTARREAFDSTLRFA